MRPTTTSLSKFNCMNSLAKQAGAAILQFALTVSLFLLFVLGIMEFAILIMDMSRANEMTRELSRISIVSDPLCDIFDNDCPGDVTGLSCPGGSPVVVTLADIGVGGCSADSTLTECRMWRVAQNFMPAVTADQVQVSYACSDAGFVDRPEVIPLITVSLENFSRPFLFAGFLGLDTGFQFPGFEVTRTGEDLYTESTL